MKNSQVITKYPPFNTLGNHTLKNLINNNFKYTTIPQNTLILKKNNKINKIGFICSGKIDVELSSDNNTIVKNCSLGKGEYFGITALFGQGISLVSGHTTEPVECFIIDKNKFVKIIADNARLKVFFENILLEKLSLLFCDPLLDIQSRQNLITKKNCTNNRLKKTMEYINSNYMSSITLDKLAQSNGLSKFYFCRMFKKATGHSVKNYINRKRLNAAKKLLQKPGINITEACFSVGFNDVSYFARLFRKYEGINPSSYKKSII